MTESSENAAQIEYWNGRAGQSWTELADAMDQSLARMSRVLLEAAAARPGERVLDVGCGTGDTTIRLADAVTSTGRVTGVDVSAPMLALARTRASGRAQVDFQLGDAASVGLGGPHDLALSRFGVMFFADPVRAFRNVAASMGVGARLVFVCWQDLARSEWLALPLRTIAPHLTTPPAPPVDPDAPGPGAFARPERVRAVLEAAGFSSITLEPHTDPVVLGRDVDDARRQMLRIGPVARALAEEPTEARERIASALDGMLRELATHGPLALDASYWLVRATR